MNADPSIQPLRLWLARLLIGAVLFFNLQCAVVFVLWPTVYAPGFELSGIPGEGMVRGMGILFLMWNVPYVIACWHPIRHRVSLYEAVVMQAIGLAGETLIYINLPPGHALLAESVGRFILFDGGGLVALIAAAISIEMQNFASLRRSRKSM